MANATRVMEVIRSMTGKNIVLNVDNIITQSLFSTGGTLTHADKALIERQIREYQTEQEIKNKFRHLSNRELVTRINGLPDFKWDDEGYELSRRIKASNGKFEAKMIGNNIAILKDEK